VLASEVTTSADPGGEAITRALAETPANDHSVARLNPADVATLGDTRALPPGVTVIADASVGRGGCVLEVGPAMIDARIETALERVRHVLDDAIGPR
jgi:flagellar assembly protein FliH